MKILFFVDTHGSEQYHREIVKKSKNVDLVVCAGDFTIFEHNMPSLLRMFDSIGKPFILIHSNHETSSGLMAACQSLRNVKFIYNSYYVKDKVIFFCYGGGGFSITDKSFDVIAENLMRTKQKDFPNHKLIFVTHQPPHNTNLDNIGEHVGNINFRKFIERHQPLYAISGHIHETFDIDDKIGKTILFNPGPIGRIIEI